MHKIFGNKENEKYTDRVGVYLIPVKDGKVGVVETHKGYFLVGGGLENGETDEQCIMRECLEEAGYTVCIKQKLCSAETYCLHSAKGFFHPIQSYYLGTLIKKVHEPLEPDHKFVWLDFETAKENMYSEMQSWAIEQALEFQ